MHLITHARTAELCKAMEAVEVAVVGDIMLDRYFWGAVHRVSPEAPVPVVDIDDESFHLGGAANVATNLAGLGIRPLLCGVVGNDASGKVLTQLVEQGGLDTDGIVVDNGRPTTVKTRVIGNNQQIVRLDRETREHVSEDVVEKVVALLASRPMLRAIVMEDYDKGLLSPQLITRVMSIAKSLGIPVFVDPKRRHFFDFTECFLFKPNRSEVSDALGVTLKTQTDLEKAGARLLQNLRCENVLVTLGSEGMMLFERNGSVNSVPTRANNVADVSGAGDTVIATIAGMVTAGASVREAAALANVAAGIVVGEPGIVAVTAQRLIDTVASEETIEKVSA